MQEQLRRMHLLSLQKQKEKWDKVKENALLKAREDHKVATQALKNGFARTDEGHEAAMEAIKDREKKVISIALSDTHKEYKDAIDSLKSKHKAVLVSTKRAVQKAAGNQHSKVLAQTEERHNDFISRLEDKFHLEHTQTSIKTKSELTALEASHAAGHQDARESHETELEEIRAKLREDHASALAALHHDHTHGHEERMQAIVNGHADAHAALKDEHANRLEEIDRQLKEEQEEQLSAHAVEAEEHLESRRAEATLAHEKAMEAMLAEQEAKYEALTEAAANAEHLHKVHQDEAKAMNYSREMVVLLKDEQLGRLEVNNAKELDAQRREYTLELKDHAESWQEKISEKQAAVAALHEELGKQRVVVEENTLEALGRRTEEAIAEVSRFTLQRHNALFI